MILCVSLSVARWLLCADNCICILDCPPRDSISKIKRAIIEVRIHAPDTCALLREYARLRHALTLARTNYQLQGVFEVGEVDSG
ncbi:hypothetical protein BJ166DRAFT_525713 [Pestalotiopsis sp. NC0098]|nr:hypothetical protein BJ166DRAFT_525713 [Pestalotiopsis sp. NC0098]